MAFGDICMSVNDTRHIELQFPYGSHHGSRRQPSLSWPVPSFAATCSFPEAISGWRVDAGILVLGNLRVSDSPEVVLSLQRLQWRKTFGSGAAILFRSPELPRPRLSS